MLDGVPVFDIGANALVVFVVLMIFTDRLVTRRRLVDVQKERDEWRETAQETLKANQEERAQKRELLDAIRTANRFIEATAQAAAGAHPERKP